MNPWVVDPLWTAFCSFHSEMRLAEEMGNDFLHAHHRVASLYFAITAVEAQLNQTIRLLREKRSENGEEIEWDIRHLNLEAKFRQLAKLANDSAVPFEARAFLRS